MNKKELNDIFTEAGGVDSFTAVQAVSVLKKLIDVITDMGLNINDTQDFLTGYKALFNLELYHVPDFNAGDYVFVPNHVSEFDGPLFGLLHPRMLVMAKKAWTDDPVLYAFLTRFFKVVGVDRKDRMSGALGLIKCIEHIKGNEPSAATIFVQQTIADINLIQPEDIASGALSVRRKTGAAIIPVFCEQVSLYEPTRIVFGDPMETADPGQFGVDWLQAELRMQSSLTNPPARRPLLSKKHATPISLRDF